MSAVNLPSIEVIPCWSGAIVAPKDLVSLHALTGCEAVLHTLLKQPVSRVVLDCAAITSISPTALDMLTNFQRDLRSTCGSLRLANVSEVVRAQIAEANMVHVFVICADVDAALSDHAPRRAG